MVFILHALLPYSNTDKKSNQKNFGLKLQLKSPRRMSTWNCCWSRPEERRLDIAVEVSLLPYFKQNSEDESRAIDRSSNIEFYATFNENNATKLKKLITAFNVPPIHED